MGVIEVVSFARRLFWRHLRPVTRGVKVLVLNASDEVLLVRNSYGNRAAYVLPGGGVRPFERAEVCASREIWEELRCRLTELTVVGEFCSTQEGKRDTVTLYAARTFDEPRAVSREIAEAGFFPLSCPPLGTSPATLRRLAEARGERRPSVDW